MVGYSGTALAKKLGIKAGCRMSVISAPAHYDELLAPLPANVERVRKPDGTTQLVHIFATRRVELEKALRDALSKIPADGAIWISWPKKAAKVPTDITEDVIREVALPLGLVDIKVCAVDEVWSGLKLVVRKELRPPRARTARRSSR
jgi:hypothetical protein